MSMADRSFQEKRDYIRMRMEAPVTLVHGTERLSAMCRDLSSSGMLLETEGILKAGDLVEVIIPSGNASIQDLHAHGRVVRVSETHSGKHAIGIEVSQMC